MGCLFVPFSENWRGRGMRSETHWRGRDARPSQPKSYHSLAFTRRDRGGRRRRDGAHGNSFTGGERGEVRGGLVTWQRPASCIGSYDSVPSCGSFAGLLQWIGLSLRRWDAQSLRDYTCARTNAGQMHACWRYKMNPVLSTKPSRESEIFCSLTWGICCFFVAQEESPLKDEGDFFCLNQR